MSNSQWHSDQSAGERAQREWEHEGKNLRACVAQLEARNAELEAALRESHEKFLDRDHELSATLQIASVRDHGMLAFALLRGGPSKALAAVRLAQERLSLMSDPGAHEACNALREAFGEVGN